MNSASRNLLIGLSLALATWVWLMGAVYTVMRKGYNGPFATWPFQESTQERVQGIRILAIQVALAWVFAAFLDLLRQRAVQPESYLFTVGVFCVTSFAFHAAVSGRKKLAVVVGVALSSPMFTWALDDVRGYSLFVAALSALVVVVGAWCWTSVGVGLIRTYRTARPA